MSDTIYRQMAIDEVHGAIYEFFDICDDDEESPMTYKDKQLLELNKAITIRIKQLPSASPKGKWILNREGNWCCPFCGNDPYHSNMHNMNFCPNCGADLREEGE